MVHRWAREMKEAFRGWGEASVEMGVNVEYVGETLRGGWWNGGGKEMELLRSGLKGF